MRSISEVKQWASSVVPQYLVRTSPQGLPTASKYFNAYVQSLLTSDVVYGALSGLDECTEANSDPEVGALNFVLQSYCSVVGVAYKPDYREAILRCLVKKDLAFFDWLFKKYLGVELRVDETHGGYSYGIYSTDVPNAFTGSGYFTDMIVRSSSVLFITCLEADMGAVYEALTNYWDLFLLVLPARLPLIFNFVPEWED